MRNFYLLTCYSSPPLSLKFFVSESSKWLIQKSPQNACVTREKEEKNIKRLHILIEILFWMNCVHVSLDVHRPEWGISTDL